MNKKRGAKAEKNKKKSFNCEGIIMNGLRSCVNLKRSLYIKQGENYDIKQVSLYITDLNNKHILF